MEQECQVARSTSEIAHLYLIEEFLGFGKWVKLWCGFWPLGAEFQREYEWNIQQGL